MGICYFCLSSALTLIILKIKFFYREVYVIADELCCVYYNVSGSGSG